MGPYFVVYCQSLRLFADKAAQAGLLLLVLHHVLRRRCLLFVLLPDGIAHHRGHKPAAGALVNTR